MYWYSKNVIHRDIKPENIIRQRKDRKLVLVDFGAAKVEANQNLSITGTVIGTQEYTAPEQLRGKAKFASDLYSLGVTCLQLLTKVTPFDLFDAGEGDWVWRDYLRGNPVSQELGQVLDKLIESATKRRYQTVAEVLTVLAPKSSLSSPLTFTTPKKPTVPPQNQGRGSAVPNTYMSFLKMLLGLALMLLGIYFLSKNIFVTTNVYPYWWHGISADLSILSLVVGIVTIFMMPGGGKYLGWGLVGFGVVMVFASSRAILRPTSLWQFFVATSSFVAGYKLLTNPLPIRKRILGGR